MAFFERNNTTVTSKAVEQNFQKTAEAISATGQLVISDYTQLAGTTNTAASLTFNILTNFTGHPYLDFNGNSLAAWFDQSSPPPPQAYLVILYDNTGTAAQVAQNFADATNAAHISSPTQCPITASVIGAQITLTADSFGTGGNGLSVHTFNTSGSTDLPNQSGENYFTGGSQITSVTVAGHTLTQGVDWTAATSNDVTAASLATAIDNLAEVSATPVSHTINAEAQITYVVEGMPIGTTITIGSRTYTFVEVGTITDPHSEWEASTNPDNTFSRTAANFLNMVYADPASEVNSGSALQNIGDSGIGSIASPRIFYITAKVSGAAGNAITLSTNDPDHVQFTAPTLDVADATTLAGGVDGNADINITVTTPGAAGNGLSLSSNNTSYLSVTGFSGGTDPVYSQITLSTLSGTNPQLLIGAGDGTVPSFGFIEEPQAGLSYNTGFVVNPSTQIRVKYNGVGAEFTNGGYALYGAPYLSIDGSTSTLQNGYYLPNAYTVETADATSGTMNLILGSSYAYSPNDGYGAGAASTIIKTDSSSNPVIFTPESGTVGGQSTYTLYNQNDWVQPIFDGTNWQIINANNRVDNQKIVLGNSGQAFIKYSSNAGAVVITDADGGGYIYSPGNMHLAANIGDDENGNYAPELVLGSSGIFAYLETGTTFYVNNYFNLTTDSANNGREKLHFQILETQTAGSPGGNQVEKLGFSLFDDGSVNTVWSIHTSYHPLVIGIRPNANPATEFVTAVKFDAGGVKLQDGSSSTPSLSFDSNTNYGIYLNPGNPSVNITTNGNDAIVCSDGEIDIETAFVDVMTSAFVVEGFGSGKKSIVTDEQANIALGSSSTSTSRTDGFPNIPVISGTPIGTPTAVSGSYAPIVVDSGANKLWVYIGGTWKFATLS